MRVRSIHPIVSHVSGVLKFAPVAGTKYYEADLPDDVATALIGLAISQGTDEFTRAPEREESHGATPASVEPPNEEDPDEIGELVDDPADEAGEKAPARRGRRGGSRVV